MSQWIEAGISIGKVMLIILNLRKKQAYQRIWVECKHLGAFDFALAASCGYLGTLANEHKKLKNKIHSKEITLSQIRQSTEFSAIKLKMDDFWKGLTEYIEERDPNNTERERYLNHMFKIIPALDDVTFWELFEFCCQGHTQLGNDEQAQQLRRIMSHEKFIIDQEKDGIRKYLDLITERLTYTDPDVFGLEQAWGVGNSLRTITTSFLKLQESSIKHHELHEILLFLFMTTKVACLKINNEVDRCKDTGQDPNPECKKALCCLHELSKQPLLLLSDMVKYPFKDHIEAIPTGSEYHGVCSCNDTELISKFEKEIEKRNRILSFHN